MSVLSILKGNLYYECGLCSGGDFYICSVCFEIRALCLDHSHALVKHVG